MRKKGFGIIITIVLALLFILAAGVFVQGSFSNAVLRNTSKVVIGREAQRLAGDLLTKGHFHLARTFNSNALSGGLYYRIIREKPKDFSTSIPLSELGVAKRQLLENEDFSVVDECLKVNVPKQLPTSHAWSNDYDRCGFVELKVTVRHEPTGVVRSVKRTYEFTVSLPSVPRPLDRYTLLIAQGRKFANSGKVTINRALSNATECLASTEATNIQLIEQYERAIKSLRDEEAPGEFISIFEEIRNLCVECKSRLSKPVTLHKVGDGNKPERAVYLYPEFDFSLVSKEKHLRLENLDIAGKTSSFWQEYLISNNEYLEANQVLNAAFEEMMKNFKNKSGSPQAVKQKLSAAQKRWCQSAEELTALAEAFLLADIQPIQAVTKPLSSTDMEQVNKSLGTITPKDWYSRSTVFVKRHEELQQFLRRKDGCSGVFFSNSLAALTVDQKFSGRCVIVTKGDCHVKRATVRDKNRDTITIVSFGNLTIHGDVDGSIVAYGSLSKNVNSNVKGTMIVKNPRASGDYEMKGPLTFDSRLVSGPEEANGKLDTLFSAHQLVNLSPYPLVTKVTR